MECNVFQMLADLNFQAMCTSSSNLEIGEASDMEIFCIKVFILSGVQPNARVALKPQVGS